MCFNTGSFFTSELPSSRKRKISRVCYIPALNLRNDNFHYPTAVSLFKPISFCLLPTLPFFPFFLISQVFVHMLVYGPSSVVRYVPRLLA